MQARDLDCFRLAEWRQDRRKALGEHRLAGARRAAQQRVVGAGGGDHDRPDGVLLPPHVAEIRSGEIGWALAPGVRRHPIAHGGARRIVASSAAEHTNGAAKVLDDGDVQAIDQPGLVRARAGDCQPAEAGSHGGLRDRQCPTRRPDGAVKGELAEQRDALELIRRKLPAGSQDRAGEREIEPGSCLGHVARCEIGGHSPRRELISRVEDRRLDALTRLTHRGIGKSHDRERGQPGPDVHLDGHAPGVQAFNGERMRSCKHGDASSRRCSGLEQAKLGRAWDGTLVGVVHPAHVRGAGRRMRLPETRRMRRVCRAACGPARGRAMHAPDSDAQRRPTGRRGAVRRSLRSRSCCPTSASRSPLARLCQSADRRSP